MEQLRADKLIIVRDGYTEERVSVWKEGKFSTPIAVLTKIEAERLRDSLTAAIDRKLPLLTDG
jgi:hypothetical protein